MTQNQLRRSHPIAEGDLHEPEFVIARKDMLLADSASSSSALRTVLVSQRMVKPQRSRCLFYTLEDLVHDWGAARIVAPERSVVSTCLRARALIWAIRCSHRVLNLLRPLAPREPGCSFDLLFFGCQDAADVLDVAQMLAWQRRAKVTACFIEELWRRSIPMMPAEVKVLAQFDFIFVGCLGSVEALEEATGRPCFHLSPSVDALRFNPFPKPPVRAIDVYAMGRRQAHVHAVLLDRSKSTGLFYLYDTAGDAAVTDVFEHRSHFIDLVQRTNCFVVSKAKVNIDEDTGGQEEVGYRYYEGAAGGAVLVGSRPNSPAFERSFGWSDSVVEATDAASVARVIDELANDPERVEAIRRANVVHSLRQHDHVYRWERVLKTVGIPPTPEMIERKELLEQAARAIESSPEAAARST